MRRAALALAAALLLSPALFAAEENVFVVKPGKTLLRSEPKISGAAKGPVGYGQKLVVKKREGEWFLVAVPGETLEGWIVGKAVTDKRPGLDAIPVGDAASKVAASETTSTAGAMRGLDGRTAGYASAKQIPPEALAQLGRLEAHAERQFADPHAVNAKGVWVYPDVTVPGRWRAAEGFAREEGLRVSRPPSTKPPSAAPSPTPSPKGNP